MFNSVKALGRIPRVVSDESNIPFGSPGGEAAPSSQLNACWPQPTNSLQHSASSSTKSGKKLVMKPGINDVLCGRGGAANSHIGNMRFRNFLDKYRDQYHNSTKSDKTHIAIQLVLHIQTQVSPPGRFLMKVPKSEMPAGNNDTTECWYEIDVIRAAKKVAQRLREKKMPSPSSSAAAIKKCKNEKMITSLDCSENNEDACASSFSEDQHECQMTASQEEALTAKTCSSGLSPTLIFFEEGESADDTQQCQLNVASCSSVDVPASSFVADIMKPSPCLPTAADLVDSVFII